MATNEIERLRYYQRQYLGAQDFEDQQHYHREMRRRHNLAHHTWGIVAGLELEEISQPGVSGEIDIVLRPGMAVDGYGREIVVLNPFKPGQDLFISFARLVDLDIYIRYQDELDQIPREGYEICDTQDQSTRIRETYRFLVEPDVQQHSIWVDGQQAKLPSDPSLGASPIKPYDESVPYQELLDERGVYWLIYVGSVLWDGANNRFVPLDELPEAEREERRRQRSARRQYVGSVAASVVTPAAELRIGDRFTQSPLDESNTGVSVLIEGTLRVDRHLTAMQDLQINGDRLLVNGFDAAGEHWVATAGDEPESHFMSFIGSADDAAEGVRFAPGGQNAVYIGEGKLRIDGEATLINGFDGIDHWLKTTGADPGSRFMRFIGSAGGNAVGVAISPGNRLGLYVDNLGKTGIGTETPGAFLHVRKDAADPLTLLVENTDPNGGAQVIAREAETRAAALGYVASGAAVFRDMQPNTAFLAALSGASALALNHQGVGPITFHTDNWRERMRITAAGYVGIGSSNPSRPLAIRAQGLGEELIAFEDHAGATRWHLNQNLAGTHRGLNFAETGVADGRLFLEAGGQVGIGTLSPAATLHVNGAVRANALMTTLYTADGTSSQNLSSSNEWADFPGLVVSFTVTERANIIAFYEITMAGQDPPDGDSHLVTRLMIDSISQIQSRSITGNTTYWSPSSLWIGPLAAGPHIVKVQYRTPHGGTNNPGGFDWHNRVLHVLVLGV